jgi:hypothetical protein
VTDNAFLERYYNGIDRNLKDPGTSARYPKADRYRDLLSLESRIWEDLSGAMIMESLPGYAEATITLKNGVSYYRFPPGIRQLIQFERRGTFRSTGEQVIDLLRSQTYYDGQRTWSFNVTTTERSLRVYPAPILAEEQDWTLVYLRKPGRLHYAQASEVGAKTLTTGTPPTNAGDLVLLPNYYNGMDIRVFSADTGQFQSREIVGFSIVNGKGVFLLRHEWDPLPTGSAIWYETAPFLPEDIDDLYALDAALLELNRRKQENPGLENQRQRLWSAALSWVSSNAADTPPGRLRPTRNRDLEVSGEIPFM